MHPFQTWKGTEKHTPHIWSSKLPTSETRFVPHPAAEVKASWHDSSSHKNSLWFPYFSPWKYRLLLWHAPPFTEGSADIYLFVGCISCTFVEDGLPPLVEANGTRIKAKVHHAWGRMTFPNDRGLAYDICIILYILSYICVYLLTACRVDTSCCHFFVENFGWCFCWGWYVKRKNETM